jgi:hypothetical protein
MSVAPSSTSSTVDDVDESRDDAKASAAAPLGFRRGVHRVSVLTSLLPVLSRRQGNDTGSSRAQRAAAAGRDPHAVNTG